MNGKKGNNNATASSEPLPPPPPLSSPPPLETARIYSHHSSPPNSPPPLAQATLPATASIPLTSSRMHQSSPGRSSSSSSPDTAYPPNDHHLVSLQSQGLSNPPNYNYRSGTTTYQEQSQGPGYTYVHTTPITQPSSGSSNGNSFSSYSNSPDNFNLSPIQQNQNDQRDNSPVSISSRHSISHISHPHSSYHSSSTSPSSPASSHSHHSGASGPPTPNVPTYSTFHDDSHSYHQQNSHHGNGIANDEHQPQHPHSHSQPHVLSQQNGNNYHSYGRFDSPPLTLAPIQGERLIRRDDSRHSQNHNYIHAQSVGDYPYQGMGLGHGAWKSESGMRKGLGAALVWRPAFSVVSPPVWCISMDFFPSSHHFPAFFLSFVIYLDLLSSIHRRN